MNKNLQHETPKLQCLVPVNQCSPRRRHAEQAHRTGCSAVEQWGGWGRGQWGHAGPPWDSLSAIVQAEWTGQSPYFTTKNLQTNCKLEDLTTSSPKASIWQILPSSQTRYGPGSTSCPTVSCQAPAAAGLKGQFSSVQPSLWGCSAAGCPTLPACKHFP